MATPADKKLTALPEVTEIGNNDLYYVVPNSGISSRIKGSVLKSQLRTYISQGTNISITGAGIQGDPFVISADSSNSVTSVNGETGEVVLDADDISETGTRKYVSAAEKASILTALQPGDNISELNNDAGYTTNAGTVTEVTGTAGVTVANGTTTPVIGLGAITPTSVNASGTVAGSNLSGTNTGDQTTIAGNAGTATALQTSRTIGTATGDVTSAGSSFNGTANNSNAYTISNDAVTNAKAANMATATIKGRTTAGTGDPEDLTAVQAKGVLGFATTTVDNAISRYDGTGGNTQNSSVTIDDNGGIIVPGVTSSSFTAKKIEYDNTLNQWIAYDNDSSVALNLGYETWFLCKNNTGLSIPNGSVVYINGADTGTPTIALAKADAGGTTVAVGITTEAIANGATGKVTQSGLVNGVNTGSLSAGAVYVSETTAGALTNTAPTAPNYRMRVGFVGVINASTGSILVTPSTAALGNGTANQVEGMNAAGTAKEAKSIVGTANQILITNTAGQIQAGFVTSPVLPSGTTATTQTANDNSTKLATTAYADAKVENNLTASTTVAPSKTAVNTALAGKQDVATWIDYSATSTVVGWSSTTTKSIRILTVGKVKRVQFKIIGTSNATTVSFTVDGVSGASSVGLLNPCYAVNNGAAAVVGRLRNVAGSAVINFDSTIAGGAWIAALGKEISGEFCLEID